MTIKKDPPSGNKPPTQEALRIQEQTSISAAWRLWGPYLSERQWGTVREDYSANGDAWNYFPYEHAHSRTYRWGEDGIAGISDINQYLCVGLALWNERDPTLKERLFGLTNTQGNHGEDVKELYYYLDATPTHSYLKMLYKYPQAEFPYARLREEGRRRVRNVPEFEIIDTGIFNEDRYFDVVIEYAKADTDDILMKITVHNRGTVDAPLHVLPQLWFRNTWSWGHDATKPRIAKDGDHVIELQHVHLGNYFCHCDAAPALLFCENETNVQRLYGVPKKGYFKDAFHDYVVNGQHEAVNYDQVGTKAAAHYRTIVLAHGTAEFRLRLSKSKDHEPFGNFEAVLQQRRREADEFYAALQEKLGNDDEAKSIQRQAFAGLIWNKQFYYFDIPQWINGDPAMPKPPPERIHGRNSDWQHLNNADIISMPDKWEFPWYATWDLAFHCVPLALIDAPFAKNQLVLMLREWYMHPNGQIPAYEWSFGDSNPPVHAWAAWEVYKLDREANGGVGDRAFLERVLHKLIINFTWWVNRKDPEDRNIFQGGFLGLDNIGVFDRSVPLPAGGFVNQTDATGWMAMYCLNLMHIALELAVHHSVYEDIATKFFEHFLYIAKAMNNIGDQGIGLWNEDDQFFYDVLRLPGGKAIPLKIRSMVGLIPLFAVQILESDLLNRVPDFKRRMEWFLNYRPDLAGLVSHWNVPGMGERKLLSLLRGHRMNRLLARMLDETEFLSDYGVRSLSKTHAAAPYVYQSGEHTLSVSYLPGESDSGVFGGNSNWRGPVWFPMNYLIINALHRFAEFYGDDYRVECPTGSGRMHSLREISDELTRRLVKLFRMNGQDRIPVLGDNIKLNTDPHFRNHHLFYEYFHGETGQGLGASHQTGWTALIAKLLNG